METSAQKSNFWKDLLKLITNKNLLLCLLMTSLNASGQFMARTPVNAFGKELGITTTILGFITTAMGIAKMVCRPVAGYGSDKLPIKKWLVFAVIVRTATYIAYALTTNTAMFIIARMLEGASFALLGTALYTVASNAGSKKMLGTAMAMYATLPKLFLMVMPTLSMILYEGKGKTVPFWWAAAFTAAILILIPFLDSNVLDTPVKKTESKKFSFFGNIAKKGLIFTPMCWANSAIISAEDLIVVVYATALGYPVAGGLYFSLKNTVSLIANIPISALADKIGAKWVCCFGFLTKAIAFVSLALFPSAITFSIAGALVGLGMPMQNVQQALAVRILPRSQAGIANGTHLLITDVGIMLLSPLCGFIVDAMDYKACFLIFAVLGALGCLAYWLLDKRINNMVVEAEQLDAVEA